MLDSRPGRIAVGWLIVEDLAMVLALVLLPALAGVLGGDARGVAGHAGGGSLLDHARRSRWPRSRLFLVAHARGRPRGSFPGSCGQVARTGSRELFTLSVLAIALGIAYGSAELFGVSFALGAFFAGVVLSESTSATGRPRIRCRCRMRSRCCSSSRSACCSIRRSWCASRSRSLAVLAVIVFGKSLAAFGIVLAFGYPVATALTVSASLAQIGEFSFILAGLGVTLGLLPTEGRDLILAGALLSIMLNSAVFAATGPARDDSPRPASRGGRGRAGPCRGLRRRSRTTRVVSTLNGHAIIIGYGRVGGAIGNGLMALDLPLVVIEQDRQRAAELRAPRHPRRQWRCDQSRSAGARGRRPGPRYWCWRRPKASRRRASSSWRANSTPASISRSAPPARARWRGSSIRASASRSWATREVAFGLMDYALRRLGIPEAATQLFIRTMRGTGEGGAFDRRPEEPDRHTPELRAHREPEAHGT